MAHIIFSGGGYGIPQSLYRLVRSWLRAWHLASWVLGCESLDGNLWCQEVGGEGGARGEERRMS